MRVSARSLTRTLLYGPLIVALASVCSSTSRAGQLVTDETTRLKVLRLTFPNAKISTLPTQPVTKPFPVKDFLERVISSLQDNLEDSPAYKVIGPVAEREEGPASNITDPIRPPSNQRRVQMHLYRWERRDLEPLLVAVLSYSFLDANPPRCCRALGEVVLLSSEADRILDVLDKVPYAFTMFTDVRFLPGGSTSGELLMISADYSGVATVGVSSLILEVAENRLKPLISVPTVVQYEAELENADVHTLTFDERRTHLAGGDRFVFVKRSYVDKGKVLNKVVTTSVSYPVGTGLPLDWY